MTRSDAQKLGRKIGYLRVSTDEQRPDRQIDGLEHICDELRLELGVSATAKSRPIFDQLREDLSDGDTLVVWALDRAFRSTLDAIQTADALRARGVHLEIVSLNVNTATPEGKFVYTLMAALAEMERDVLRQRTKEGLAAARKRGKTLGRPRALSDDDLRLAAQMLEDEYATIKSVAEHFGVTPITLSRSLKALEA